MTNDELTADDLTTGTEIVYQKPNYDVVNEPQREYDAPIRGTVVDVVEETKHVGINRTIDQTLVVIEDTEGEEHRVDVDNFAGETEWRVGTVPDEDDEDDEDGGTEPEVEEWGDDEDARTVEVVRDARGRFVSWTPVATVVESTPRVAIADGGRDLTDVPTSEWDHSHALEAGDELIDADSDVMDDTDIFVVREVHDDGSVTVYSNFDDENEVWTEDETRRVLADSVLKRVSDGLSHELATF